MKLYKKIVATLSICLLAASCGDIVQTPTGELSSANAFLTSGEIEKYCNKYYNLICKTHSGFGTTTGIGCGDNKTDNTTLNSINTRLAGGTAFSSAASLTEYTYIRGINFLINNFDNCSEDTDDTRHSWGEAHYFRAYYYYELLKDYGPVSWVTEVLDASTEATSLPRDSRTTIVDNILADLDIAIENLYEQDGNTSMRIHKDVARTFKAEVALFEGTWEKYHKGSVFADPDITDSKITEYLEIAAESAKEVMDRGVWGIYTGDGDNSYNRLFILTDHSNTNEVLWWKKYSYVDGIAHSFTYYHRTGGAISGLSKSLVDDYLTDDGRPFVGDERDNAKLTYPSELENRDPRLTQTCAAPGQQMYLDAQGDVGLTFGWPRLDGESNDQNMTGYSILKHVEWDTDFYDSIAGMGEAAAIQYRYAEVLLIYAEALAELDGEKYASEIITTLQPLRDRVNMPAMDFDREYNTEDDYGFKDLDKYIQAVRRERRIEFAIEDHRFYDLMRWAAADELIVGKSNLGMLYTGTNLETYYDSSLTERIIINSDGYVQPYTLDSYPTGWAFNLDRDYLLPIETRMITLTGGLWEQNPGW